VWVQILGAGGPDLDDRGGGPSYAVWIDGAVRLLVEAGPGASVALDKSAVRFNDVQAIALTHLHADHTADLPALIMGSSYLGREEPLTVLGPDGNDTHPDTEAFLTRLIGPQGAWPDLARFLTYSGGYKVRARNVTSSGQRRWSRFGNALFRLSAIPVHHGTTPAIAWRVDVGEQSIVFTGDFNNQKNTITEFAKGVDALVVSHAIPETARGTSRDEFATPSQLGRIASQAQVRMMILGHRTTRTRGRETQTAEAIKAAGFTNALIFANDMECWGL
jgi:ribonuclease BN (tRNA processing enzyme)